MPQKSRTGQGKRMGRPRLPEARKRTERVTVNFTKDERQELERLAKDESLSDFLRRIALRHLARRKR